MCPSWYSLELYARSWQRLLADVCCAHVSGPTRTEEQQRHVVLEQVWQCVEDLRT